MITAQSLPRVEAQSHERGKIVVRADGRAQREGLEDAGREDMHTRTKGQMDTSMYSGAHCTLKYYNKRTHSGMDKEMGYR